LGLNRFWWLRFARGPLSVVRCPLQSVLWVLCGWNPESKVVDRARVVAMLQDVAFVASAGFGVRAWGFSEGGEGASGSGERMTDKSVHPTSIRPTRSVRPTANVRPTRLRTPILPPLNGGCSRPTCCTFFG